MNFFWECGYQPGIAAQLREFWGWALDAGDEAAVALGYAPLDPALKERVRAALDYTIVIVTHNMQQAARISDRTAFFTTEVNPERDTRTGVLIEFDETPKIFSNPSDERTESYVTSRFG